MADFAQQFETIYKIFLERSAKDGNRPSKSALAKFLGVSNGKLQKWESGQVPLPDDLEMLHHTFGLSYAWLITGEGEPIEAVRHPERTEVWRMEELEKENYALKARLEETEAELREERSLNRQLTTRLLIEGDSNEKSVGATAAKAAGQE